MLRDNFNLLLEEIRLIANIEGPKAKLLQMILAGQLQLVQDSQTILIGQCLRLPCLEARE